MRIVIQSSVLDNIFTSLQPFLDKKDSSQITSHIYFETQNNKLICKATDFEIGLCTFTEQLEIQEQGIATVNGKQALDIVKRLKDGEVELYTNSENETLNIKQNKSSFKLQMFNAQEFPIFPEYESLPKLEIDSSQLINSMKKIFPVVDVNNIKRELNGAALVIKEYSYDFVASDTKRLAVINYNKATGGNVTLIFPKKSITEIQKLFFDNIELYYSEKSVILKSQNYVFFSHLINGTFPGYEKIIPKELKTQITIPKSKIIEGIKLINAITNDVKITFRKNEILFESISQDNSEAKTQIDINIDIEEDIEIGFSSKHILDFLNSVDTAEFVIGLNETNASVVLQSENFKTVIMPIIL